MLKFHWSTLFIVRIILSMPWPLSTDHHHFLFKHAFLRYLLSRESTGSIMEARDGKSDHSQDPLIPFCYPFLFMQLLLHIIVQARLRNTHDIMNRCGVLHRRISSTQLRQHISNTSNNDTFQLSANTNTKCTHCAHVQRSTLNICAKPVRVWTHV